MGAPIVSEGMKSVNFRALSIEDAGLFHQHLGGYPFSSYEYSFASLYQWRKLCQTQYCLLDDVIVVMKTERGMGPFFMQPINIDSTKIDAVVAQLVHYKQSHPEMKYLFGDVEASFFEQLIERYGSDLTYTEDADNYDYIYNSGDLITLSGNRYHRKKNQYNQFVHNYEYEIRDIRDEQVRRDCMEFAFHWYENNPQEDSVLRYELTGVRDVLSHLEKLRVRGIAVYIRDQIVGFAFGERVNDEMAIIHCEKGDTSYSGVYAFLNRTLVETHFSDVALINRQEDMGIEGLRRAKMAYNPTRLEKKFFVDIVRA